MNTVKSLRETNLLLKDTRFKKKVYSEASKAGFNYGNSIITMLSEMGAQEKEAIEFLTGLKAAVTKTLYHYMDKA